MPETRLTSALTSGAVSLPDKGRIGVWNAASDADLSSLPIERLHIIQTFYPDHQHWRRQGLDVAVTADADYGGAIVFLPRAKDLARAMIADAAEASAGAVIVDGQKHSGIESLLRDIRKRTSVGEVTSKAHGKVFAFENGDFSDWHTVSNSVAGFQTAPGVFSANSVDHGSSALVNALPADVKGRVADFGAGWGWLSAQILERPGVRSLDLIEADHTALVCAKANVTDERAHFIWHDATTFEADAAYDIVVTNPPFHQGRAADPSLGRAFIASAARNLKPSGKLWLVANRHLPYEAELRAHFIEVTEVTGDNRFKIFCAAKPRRTRR